mmetsp:Transcript_53890/g.161242  ORF Transcript_53890/g.161242 Transcript_53890/m.161242 type:complete len:305 (+) Transcript_53890:1029-1943(+)
MISDACSRLTLLLWPLLLLRKGPRLVLRPRPLLLKGPRLELRPRSLLLKGPRLVLRPRRDMGPRLELRPLLLLPRLFPVEPRMLGGRSSPSSLPEPRLAESAPADTGPRELPEPRRFALPFPPGMAPADSAPRDPRDPTDPTDNCFLRPSLRWPPPPPPPASSFASPLPRALDSLLLRPSSQFCPPTHSPFVIPISISSKNVKTSCSPMASSRLICPILSKVTSSKSYLIAPSASIQSTSSGVTSLPINSFHSILAAPAGMLGIRVYRNGPPDLDGRTVSTNTTHRELKHSWSVRRTSGLTTHE